MQARPKSSKQPRFSSALFPGSFEFLDSFAVHFLLSVPAGEGSLAHRRHVRSRVIRSRVIRSTDRLDLREDLRTQRAIARRSWMRRRLISLRAGAAHAGQKFSGHRTVARSSPQLLRARPPRLDNVRLVARWRVRMRSVICCRLNRVETFYLLFPDPWPKRRHHRAPNCQRRIS